MAGGFLATNLGGMQILGLEGWRCAFHLVAIVSVTTSVLVMWLAVDPRRKPVVRQLLLRHSGTDSKISQTHRLTIKAVVEVPRAVCCTNLALLIGLKFWDSTSQCLMVLPPWQCSGPHYCQGCYTLSSRGYMDPCASFLLWDPHV